MFNPTIGLEEDEVPMVQQIPPTPADVGEPGGEETGVDSDPLGDVDESSSKESEGGQARE